MEGKEQTELKKFYRAKVYLTPEGKQFIESIPSLPYTIQEPVIAKIPHTVHKNGITKILEIEKS